MGHGRRWCQMEEADEKSQPLEDPSPRTTGGPMLRHILYKPLYLKFLYLQMACHKFI